MVIVVGDEVLQEDLQVGFGGSHALKDVVVGCLVRLEHADHGDVLGTGGVGPQAGGKIEHGNQRQQDAHSLGVQLHG